jgi:hypothetical protein
LKIADVVVFLNFRNYPVDGIIDTITTVFQGAVMSRLSSVVRRLSRQGWDHKPSHSAQDTLLDAVKRSHLPQSTLFFTHHKCASTFVNRLLSRVEGRYGGLQAVDYEGCLWDHIARLDVPQPVTPHQVLETFEDDLFRTRGFVYGPLRAPFSIGRDQRFNRIVFIRDPRDTLVSMYYSLGWTHPVPPAPEQAEPFLALRAEAQRSTIDEFAIAHAHSWLKPLLANYREMIADAHGRVAVFHYEDLIARPDATVSSMLAVISGGATGGPTIESILKGETFVRSTKNDHHHQRSGAAGQYVKELNHWTIAQLNKLFREDLEFFCGSESGHLRRAA